MNNNNYIYVGFWKRVWATIIDYILIFLLIYTIERVFNYYISKSLLGMLLLNIAVYIGYVYFIAKHGGTPGKLYTKIEIVNKKNGYLSVQKSFLRTLPYILISLVNIFEKFFLTHNDYSQLVNIIDIVTTCIFIVDIIIIPFNKEKRAVHDFIAGSFVITRESISKSEVFIEKEVWK